MAHWAPKEEETHWGLGKPSTFAEGSDGGASARQPCSSATCRCESHREGHVRPTHRSISNSQCASGPRLTAPVWIPIQPVLSDYGPRKQYCVVTHYRHTPRALAFQNQPRSLICTTLIAKALALPCSPAATVIHGRLLNSPSFLIRYPDKLLCRKAGPVIRGCGRFYAPQRG